VSVRDWFKTPAIAMQEIARKVCIVNSDHIHQHVNHVLVLDVGRHQLVEIESCFLDVVIQPSRACGLSSPKEKGSKNGKSNCGYCGAAARRKCA
jgi:hypothetical protein